MVTSREASKCLANVLLLEPKTRQIFVDLGYPVKAAERLKVAHLIQVYIDLRLIRIKHDHREDELLNSRILFLMTYDTNLDFEELFDQHQLAESINAVRHDFTAVLIRN